MYEDRVMGKPRIHMLARRLLEDIECIGGERYSLRFVDTYTGEPSRIEVDIVIICTGYHEEVFPRSLEPLRPWIELDEKGGPHISYDYRISTTACFGPTIYLNGMCERTHGISDSASFSMMAIKADRILSSLVSNLSTPPQL
jgi:L-ornithine N5-oxygenase